MKKMTITKAAIITAMSLTASAVYAFDYSYELSAGMSKLGKGPNGTWYQEPFPHEIELKSPSMSFGILYNKTEDSYWRSGYTYLGRGRSRAEATASDDNYAPDKPPTYCNGPCWAMSHWYGHGVVQGLYTGYVRTTKVFGLDVAGAALFATKNCGARRGLGWGPSGKSYALPTKDKYIKTLSLEHIYVYVDVFKEYALLDEDSMFFVTAIGTGLAGYKHSQIAPMFKDAPENCVFPIEWKEYLENV